MSPNWRVSNHWRNLKSYSKLMKKWFHWFDGKNASNQISTTIFFKFSFDKTWVLNILGMPKKYPLKNFANFSRTIESYDIKFYLLVTHSIIRKCGKFHYIIYRIDKITLLLVMAT